MMFDMDRLDDVLALRDHEFIETFNGRATLTSTLNHKFSPRLSSKSGIVWHYMFYDMNLQSVVDEDPETYQTFVQEDGNSQLLQAFTQTQLNLSNDLKLNAGVHYEYFVLNENTSIEPRIGIN